MKFFYLTLILIFILGGCCLIPEYQPLMNLKTLEEQRARTALVIKKEEALYNKLNKGIKENRLKKGASKKDILSEYGQPVLSRVVHDKSGNKKLSLIYRHPTESFSSDMIYLYFDDEEKLFSWEIKPAPLAKRE